MKTSKITLSEILSIITIASLLILSNPEGNLLATEKIESKTKNKLSDNKIYKTKLTPEIREQLAKGYENMAKCLRSGESLTKCRDDMRKICNQSGFPEFDPIFTD
ncbi:MAG: hypothetical protein HQK53_05775 [Oligoflexia bacterium]|nr:hypothetical protein [Oligoflexia bacterium]